MKPKVEDPQARRVREEGSLETSTGVATLRQERTNNARLEDSNEDNTASTSNTVKDVNILVKADVHDGMEGPTNKKGDIMGLEEVSDSETS